MDKITRTVYSLIYPETEKVLSDLWKSNPLDLYQDAYLGKQESFHEDFKDQWLNWTSPIVSMGSHLKFFYPTAGSSESIRESIAQYRNGRIHIFDGDYEGYSEFAKAYNIEVVRHNREDFSTLNNIKDGERFYISQPSSLDGNVWNKFPDFIKYLEENTKVELMVDLCYVGTVAKDYKIDVSSPIVHTVFFSLSKVFGVYYHRIGGVFSSKEMLGLYGNRWFKNIFSLQLGINLMKNYSVQELPRKYQKKKEEVLSQLNKENNSSLKSSDVFMLIHGDLSSSFAKQFQRVNRARICITPLLDEAMREKS